MPCIPIVLLIGGEKSEGRDKKKALMGGFALTLLYALTTYPEKALIKNRGKSF